MRSSSSSGETTNLRSAREPARITNWAQQLVCVVYGLSRLWLRSAEFPFGPATCSRSTSHQCLLPPPHCALGPLLCDAPTACERAALGCVSLPRQVGDRGNCDYLVSGEPTYPPDNLAPRARPYLPTQPGLAGVAKCLPTCPSAPPTTYQDRGTTPIGGKTTTMHSKVIVVIVCLTTKEVCCRYHASNAQCRVAAALLGHGRRWLRVHVHVWRRLLW